MEEGMNLLSLVADRDGDVVHLRADAGGLAVLISTLQKLQAGLARGQCEHDHLFSQEWAGSGLSTSMLAAEKDSGAKQIHHLKLYAWTPEWKLKHQL